MSEFNLTDYNDGYAAGYHAGFTDGEEQAANDTYEQGYEDGRRDQKASTEVVEPWHGKVRSYNPGDN